MLPVRNEAFFQDLINDILGYNMALEENWWGRNFCFQLFMELIERMNRF